MFSSGARTDVLETLFHQPDELGLRQVAVVARLHVRSAEIALAQLVQEGLVRRHRLAQRVYFALNRQHALYPLLEDVFRAGERWRIRAAAAKHQKAGRETLALMETALPMLDRARRSHRAIG